MFTDEKLQELVKHLKEYPDHVISMAFAYADCLAKYGVDVSVKWKTVTEQRDALNMAYTQGRIDEAERFCRCAKEDADDSN